MEQALQYNKTRGGDLDVAVVGLVLVESTHRAAQVEGEVSKVEAGYDGPYKIMEVVNVGRHVKLQ